MWPTRQPRRPAPRTRRTRASTPSWCEAALSPTVRDVARLAPDEVTDVLALLRAATAADGVRPVSEETELRLRHGGPDGGRDMTAGDPDGGLLGYARFEGAGDEAEAELVVAPEARHRGVASALADRIEQLAGERPLRVWSHGDLPIATHWALRRGYRRARVLLQMRRDLAGVDADPRPDLPADVTVRPFRPGRDEAAWLRVNARAFADHPEQGGWTIDDLRKRENEPWFDPAGFLLAWRGDPDEGGVLLGSHWTKVHPPGEIAEGPVGEIYVLGVDPAAQGLRLGRALTDLGLAYLRSRGLHQVLLYVEEDNTAAVRLYEGRGFRRFAVDVAWQRPTSDG